MIKIEEFNKLLEEKQSDYFEKNNNIFKFK